MKDKGFTLTIVVSHPQTKIYWGLSCSKSHTETGHTNIMLYCSSLTEMRRLRTGSQDSPVNTPVKPSVKSQLLEGKVTAN